MKIKNWKLKIGILTLLFFCGSEYAEAGIIRRPPNNLGVAIYWSLNENGGGYAGDFSGNSRTGTINGTMTAVGGKFGKGLQSDGTTGYLSVSNPVDMTGNYTYSIWIKPLTIEGAGIWAASSAIPTVTNGAGNSGNLYLNSTGTVGWYIFDGAGENITSTTVLEAGKWYHVVAVHDDTGSARYLYINGVLEAQDALTATQTFANFAIPFNRTDSDYYPSPLDMFDGGLDDIRYYGRALSASEVATLSRAGEVNRKVVSRNGLTGYWSFDEGTGTNYGDSSGNGNNGAVTGAPVWVNGKRGKAVQFDGDDDHIIVTETTALRDGNDWTMSAWVKFKSPDPGSDADRIIAGKQGWHGGFLRVTDQFQFSVTNSVGTRWYIAYDPPLEEWHHYIGTYTSSSGVMKLYVDGVYAGTTTFDTGTTMLYNGTNTLDIGGSGTSQYHTYCDIDEIKIYNRVLTDAEILAEAKTTSAILGKAGNNHNDGLVDIWSFDGPDVTDTFVYDRGPTANSGYFLGIATSSAKSIGKIGQGITFSGSHAIDLPATISLSHTSNWSMAMWVKTTAGGDQYLFTNQSGGPVTNAMRISSGKINYYHYDGIWNSESGTASVNDGVWHHLAWVNNGDSTLDMYVDGVLDADNVASNNSGPLNRIGNIWGTSPSSGLNGSMDDLRIYNRTLSASEVKQLYDAGR